MATTKNSTISLDNIKTWDNWAYIISLYPWFSILLSYILISLPGCRWTMPICAFVLYFGFFVVSGVNFVMSIIYMLLPNSTRLQRTFHFCGINSISIFWLYFIFH